MSLSDGSQCGLDIWSLICEAIYEKGTKHDLANICQVSRLLYGAGIRFLYRSIDLDFSSRETPWTAVLLRTLIRRRPEYRQLVFELSVTIGETPARPQEKLGSGHKLVQAMVLHVMRLVPILPWMRRFRWEALDTIPRPLVSLLNFHPSMKEMEVGLACLEIEHIVIPEELYNNPKLTSVSAGLYHRDDALGYEWVRQDLTQLLTRSPNLRSLKLRLNADNPHDIAPGPRIPTTQVLHFKDSDPLMSLGSLELELYNFEDTGPTSILSHIDTSALQHLSIKFCHSSSQLFENLSQQPLLLKSLNLDRLLPARVPTYEVREPTYDAPLYASVERFLLSFQGLERLAITKYGYGKLMYIYEGLLHHASSLKYLKLDIGDYRPTQQYTRANFAIPRNAFQDIIGKCDSLEDLDIYVCVNDLHESSSLNGIISRSSSLKKLIIRTTPSYSNVTDPITTKSFVLGIAQKLWPPKLESFQILCCGRPDHYNPRKMMFHWIVRKDNGEGFSIMDWCVTSERNWYRRCEKLLGESIVPPDDHKSRWRWKEELERKLQVHGAATLSSLIETM